MSDSSRHTLIVVVTAFFLLVGLSLVPWSRISNNLIKDFNIFEDLCEKTAEIASSAPQDIVDPELAKLNETESSGLDGYGAALSDSIDSDSIRPLDAAPVKNGVVLIESYAHSMLPKFKAALAQSKSRPVRIAVIGDSYIEGDIFTQDVRRLLQQAYGGSGVGFMAMFSEFPGFRRSIRQSGDGWEMHNIRTMKGSDSIRTLCCEYARNKGGQATFKAPTKGDFAKPWNRSSFVFIARDSSSVTLKNDLGEQTYKVAPSPNPQALTLDGSTNLFSVQAKPQSLIALGCYLGDKSGVQLDCMSIRGNSGIGLRQLNERLCSSMRQWVDYDLIILEFGMNVVNAKQTNYKSYASAMKAAVEKVHKTYPNADILVMGVGDRGVKAGGQVTSMSTLGELTKAQREFAAQSHCFFWDTRAAMGGDGAAAKWRTEGNLNADYIHLNHKGGALLAEKFFNALQMSINE